MSAIVGGSVRECSIKNRVFQCPADAAVKIRIGGDSNEVVATGGGNSIILKTTMVSSVEGLTVAIDNNNDDMTFLQSVADGSDYVTVTVTLADGNTYSGAMQITEPPELDTSKATCELKLAGRDKIVRQ
jgi:hypothetical protein